ncbi:MAG: flavodoxin family protein [Phototrophicaceae bacterium]
MNALVIYDSVFGNTEDIAKAIAAALNAQALPIGKATPEMLRGLDVLIMGSPTRRFRPTEGMAKFLKTLPQNYLAGVGVAAFDTRLVLQTINSSILRFFVEKGGYAASTIEKTLERLGGKQLTSPEGFYVTGEQGPLKDGELDRASAWASHMVLDRIPAHEKV